MATIVTRSGKGSPLTNAEVDGNFTNLNTELGTKANTSSLATVATTGAYSDLTGKPTNVSSLTNDSGYITSITSGNVTTALGFTPYNATNPAGYTTNVGTVTSVSGTGTVSGLTLTGSVTGAGSLTLGGAITGFLPLTGGSLNASGVADTHQFLYNESGGEIQLIDSTGAGPILLDNVSGLARLYKVGTGAMSIGTTGANYLQFITNGSDRLRIDASGSVGIGTASPASKLDVVTGVVGQIFTFRGAGTAFGFASGVLAGANALELTTAGTSGVQATRMIFRGSTDAADIEFYRGARGSETISMFIEGDNGNVGLGTITPSAKLETYQTSGGTNAVRMNTNFASGNYVDLNPSISGVSNGGYSISLNGTIRQVISYTGDVGIGTTTPVSKLHVSANAGALPPTTSAEQLFTVSGADGASARVLIDSFGGNAGIHMRRANGTAVAPTASLANGYLGFISAWGYGTTAYGGGSQVRIGLMASENWTDTARGTHIVFDTTLNGSTALTERVRIDHNGNLGIGTSSVAGRLHSVSTSGFTAPTLLCGDGVGTFRVVFQSGSYAGVPANKPWLHSYDDIYIGSDSNVTTRFMSGGVTNLAVASSGIVTAATAFNAPVFNDSVNSAFYIDPKDGSNLGGTVQINGGPVYRSDWTTRFQSGSDFVDGTLVTTDIVATGFAGDSFVIEITGKTYDQNNPPVKVIAQGYLYNNQIINYSGISYAGNFASYVKVFEEGGVLKFWWPRISYWNSFNVNVMSMDGQTNGTITRNRVTAIGNAVEPTGTKKVQITLTKTLKTGDAAGSISGFNNPVTAPTANTIVYRDSAGDISAREIVLSSGLSAQTPTVLVSMYPATNQVVRTTPAAVSAAIQGAASGSWGISVTGNAATATKATNLNQARYGNTDFNTLGSTGQFFRAYTNYIPSGGSYNQPPNGSGDYKVIQWGDVEGGDGATAGNWGGQIVQNFYTDQMWFRRSYATTWQAWREFIHDGNVGSFAMRTNASATNSVDVRAPIFYDSNDTSYYVNPNEISRTHRMGANYFETNNDVSVDTPFGLYFNGGLSQSYAIYRESGAWAHPYPDLRIAFHTGIKMGALAGYGGMRFYTNSDMATQVMSINNSADGLGGGHVFVNDVLQAGGSLRAPIFYDSDNTAYFVNPNGTSNVSGEFQIVGSGYNSLRITSPSTTQSLWVRAGYNSDGSATPAVSATNVMFQSSGSSAGTFSFVSGNTVALSIGGDTATVANYLTGTNSLRAPVFYDSQNTARYFDGVSGLNMTTGTSSRVTIYTDDSGFHIANAEGVGGDLRLGAAYNRIGIYSNPSLHVQAETSIEFWTGNTQRGYFDNASNLFANSSMRSQLFYDSNNTAYYLNPNDTQSLRTVGDWRSDSSAWTGEFSGKIQYHANHWYFQAAGQWVFRRADAVTAFEVLQNGTATALLDMRAPIFYKSNDTASRWDGNALVLRGTSPTVYFRDTDHNSAMIHCNSNLLYVLRGGNDSEAWSTVGSGAWPLVINLTNNDMTGGGTINAVTDMRAPLFYDSQDTSAYIDPAGASWIKGGFQMMNPSASNDCFGGLEMRENGLVAATQSSASYAPRVNFHWGSRAAASLYMDASGNFVFGGQSDITNNRRAIFCSDLYATGNVNAYYSDDRLKTRIGNIENALDIVSSLNGFRYVDNELAETFGYANNGAQLGVSAQEVQKHLPEIVRGAAFDVDHDDPDHGSKTGENYLTVDYSRMVPLLIEAIKELRHEVEMLKK